VFDASTHKPIVEELLRTKLQQAGLVVTPNVAAYYSSFIDGSCNVLAGESFDVARSHVVDRNYQGDYQIGSTSFSNEPLAIVTRMDDPLFSDFVNWILQGLFAAETKGIGRLSGEDRVLSTFGRVDLFGPGFEMMFVDAIVTVGNFGEIYATHLESLVSRAEANQINTGPTPLMYAYPLPTSGGPGRAGPIAGGTLDTIKRRGKLWCGVFRAAIFSELDSSGTRSGVDVSFCQAIAAAIFDGEYVNRIDYKEIAAPAARFSALTLGEIDVLSRITTITMERDVREPSTGVGFSYSLPTFHDEIHFSGRPPYGQCANDLDVTSAECQDLRICVVDGTTTIGIVKDRFPPRFVKESKTSPEMFQDFNSEQCNAIVGGYARTAEVNIRSKGYDGPYEIGDRAFSQEPVALVTRDDDHEWSAFCFWIVSAIVYAEDHGVTQDTSQQMPIVNLFGPSYLSMFRHAILAVGSYAEIYDRSASQNGLPRTGRNLLNRIPLQPQLYTSLFFGEAS